MTSPFIHSYARRKYIWARGNWYIWYPYTTLVLKIFGMNCSHTTNLSPFYHICNQGISMHLSITPRNLTNSHFQLWSRKSIKILNKCTLLVWGSTRFLTSPTLKCESISSNFSLKFPLYCKICAKCVISIRIIDHHKSKWEWFSARTFFFFFEEWFSARTLTFCPRELQYLASLRRKSIIATMPPKSKIFPFGHLYWSFQCRTS